MRAKFVIPQEMIYTKISLSEIADEVPELKGMSANDLQNNILEVKEVYESRMKCKNCNCCKNDFDKCSRMDARIEGGKVRLSSGQCDRMIQEFKNRKILRLFELAEVGARFKNRTFESFEVTKETERAFETCRKYVEDYRNSGKGLLLIGRPGSGKTHLAVGILQKWIAGGRTGLFITAPELLQKIRNGFEDGKNESYLSAAKAVELLVLDDLGSEKCTEWGTEQIFVLINHRYENNLPLILTTNLSVGELEDRFGERAVSRLIEMVDGVKIEAPDYRRRRL